MFAKMKESPSESGVKIQKQMLDGLGSNVYYYFSNFYQEYQTYLVRG